MLILNNDFAVDDGGAAVKLGCCLCWAGIALGPVEAVTGIGACFAALDNKDCAVAVVLDFMYPPGSRSRVVNCGCELWLDEVQRHAIDLAEAEKIASPAGGDCGCRVHCRPASTS